jgi:hypothetical protein
LHTSFTVRRVSHGVGVERTFLLHSPRIDHIEVLRHGQVRRAKLFYLREKVGKHARIRERRQPLGGSDMVMTRGDGAAPDTATATSDEPDQAEESEPLTDDVELETVEAESEPEPKADGEE